MLKAFTKGYEEAITQTEEAVYRECAEIARKNKNEEPITEKDFDGDFDDQMEASQAVGWDEASEGIAQALESKANSLTDKSDEIHN